MESSRTQALQCALVARGSRILAQFSDDGRPDTASKLLAQAPELHSRYSHTQDDRITCYLVEAEVTFCCAMDARLIGKQQAFGALESLRDQFRDLTKLNRDDDPHFEAVMLLPILKNLFKGRRRSTSAALQCCLSPTTTSDDDKPLIVKSRIDRRWFSSSDLSCSTPPSRTRSFHQSEPVHATLDVSSSSSNSGDAEQDSSSNKRWKPQFIKLLRKGKGFELAIGVNLLCIVLVCVYLVVCRGLSCSS